MKIENPQKLTTFVAWLVVEGFLTETPYPKVGDLVVVKQNGEVILLEALPREGVLQEQFPEAELKFYIALPPGEWERLYARFSVIV